MKKLSIFLILFPLWGTGGFAQTISTDRNAVVHSKFREETTNESDGSDPDKAVITIAYSDGLGRGLQAIGYQQSPTKKDIVSGAVQFDVYGRVIRTALTAPTSVSTGTYQSNAFGLANTFYGDAYSYSATTAFDNSPLNRAREQYGAGNAWRSNTKRVQSFDESAGTDIRYYYLNSSGDIILSGTYPSNSLYKKRLIDEQGHTSIEISDKRGRLIQKQVQDDNDYITTCYLYDGLGRILAVIQPEGFILNNGNGASIIKNSADWLKWVFSYEYDYRGRMHLKRVPASGDEYMVYDKWDRLVWSQTALQRESGKWSFYKYDAFNREIIRGEKTESRGLNALETETAAWTGSRFESRVGSGIYYSYSNSYPQLGSDTDIRQINYYDNYTDWVPSGMAYADGGTAFHAQHTEVRGLMVGSRSRSMVNNSWLVSVNYFDNKGRNIRSFSHNVYGQIEVLDVEYKHSGEVNQTKKTHKNASGTATIERTQNELDHVGRVKSVSHGINTTTLTKLSNSSFDEIGRVVKKKILPDGTYIAGGTKDIIDRPNVDGIVTQANTVDLAKRYVLLQPNTDIKAIDLTSYRAEINANAPDGININGLQTMDFTWHLRGSLLGINLDNGLATPKASEGDLFAYKLEFETANFYDGNIGKQSWQTANDQNQATGLRSYTLNYDAAKRLKSAGFTGVGNENYGIPNMNYDKNGNITNLQRKGKNGSSFTDIDNLGYNYNGNQLLGVTDAVNGNENVGDFRDNGSNSDYTYWNDGSLKSDANKGISLIEYDSFLKKVKQINIGSNWIKFFYEGNGILIRRSNSIGDVWDYMPNGMICKNGQPYQMATSEGRMVYMSGVWVYEFEYLDHLGNLRVSFRANGNQLTLIQSNTPDPFGLDIKPLNNEGITANNFQFNKIEKVNDFGINIHHAFFRDGDSQIGRWWQIDSKPNPAISLYSMMANNPIRFSDPLGDTLRIQGSNAFIKQTTLALAKLIQTKEGRILFEQLHYSKQNFTLRETTGSNGTEPPNNPNKSSGINPGDINWNPSKTDGGMEESGDNTRPAYVGLGHEMRHSADIEDKTFSKKSFITPDGTGLPTYEMTAVESENKIRANIGEGIRKFYTSNNGNWQGQTSQNGVSTFTNFSYSTIQSTRVFGGKSYVAFLQYKMSNFPANNVSNKQFTPYNNNFSTPSIK